MKGVITIKKISLILISLLIFSIVACEPQKSVTESTPLSVSITTDVDIYDHDSDSVKGITLMPQLEGSTDKDIQYHWSIDSDTERFSSQDSSKKEIINLGESVLFVSVADVGYAEADTLSNTIKITLAIEEKDSNNTLAKTELIIEDYSGIYKVKK